MGAQPARGDVNADALSQGPPGHGTDISALMDPLFDEWIPRSFTTPGPRCLACISCSGLLSASVAEFIGAATKLS